MRGTALARMSCARWPVRIAIERDSTPRSDPWLARWSDCFRRRAHPATDVVRPRVGPRRAAPVPSAGASPRHAGECRNMLQGMFAEPSGHPPCRRVPPRL